MRAKVLRRQANKGVLYTDALLMAEQSSNRSRGWVWGVVVLAALAAGYFVVRSFTHAPVEVRTATASYGDVVVPVSTTGKVEPTDDYQAHSAAPGIVQKLFVGVGDKVTRGQELLRMDTTDAASHVASARATLASAQNALQNAEHGGNQDELLSSKSDMIAAQAQEREAVASLSTYQMLQAKGAASASEVAAAQQRVTDAHTKVSALQARRTDRYSASDISALKAQVDQGRSAVTAAEAAYAGVDIRAPFNGTIYSVPIAERDYVGGGEALLNMADLNRIQVRGYFDEPEIGKLAVGQPVKIVWDAKPLQAWHGHITQAPSTVINYGTRNVGECIISVDDARGDLLPNTNVTVTVTTQQRFHVLSVPREALHTEGLVNYVYKIVDGRLSRIRVSTGLVSLTRAEITGGLNDGDTVVLSAVNEADLRDRLQVKAQR